MFEYYTCRYDVGFVVGKFVCGCGRRKIYTFSELLEMSEEEFLALDETANSCYYDMKSIPEGEARAIYGINNMQWFI